MSTTTMSRPATRRPLLMAAAVIVALGIGLYVFGGWRTAQVARESIGQPLGTAKRADVTIAMGVGQLHIGALDQPGQLVAGQIAYPEANRVDRAFTLNGDTASFTLREHDGQRNSLFKYRDDNAVWDLGLATGTPLRMRIESNIGESTLDLAKLAVTELDLNTGIGTTTLALPQAGQVRARIQGGVGSTIIRVPAGVALRLTLDTGIGGVEVRGNYQRQGNRYVSPDYDTAANRVDLTASSGIGGITIEQAN